MELLLYGDITDYTLQQVAYALQATPEGETLTMRIASGGGNAFMGTACRAMMAASLIAIDCYIDGVAASAASVIAMGASRICMAADAVMMIHNASATVSGGVDELENAIEMLNALNNAAAQAYAGRMKISVKEALALMAEEKWFTAKEALKMGLVDEIVPARTAEQRAELGDLAGRNWAQSEDPQQDRSKLMTYPKEFLNRLGLPETATEADVLAALDKIVAKPNTPATQHPQAAADAPPVDDLDGRIAAAVAAALATHTPAQAAAVEPAPTPEQVHETAVMSAVERFISEGKIAPAHRDNAIKACGKTAAQLSACVAYWTQAPRVVVAPVTPAVSATAQTRANAQAHAGGKVATLTAHQKDLARRSGVSEANMLKQINGEF